MSHVANPVESKTRTRQFSCAGAGTHSLNKESKMAARNILNNQTLFHIARRSYSSGADKNVAFLGLGNMGGFMAANLVKKVRVKFKNFVCNSFIYSLMYSSKPCFE